jgi:hypothetical protein
MTPDEVVPTLRDYFAATVPTDEIEKLTYRTLSLQAQELLAGIPHPKLKESTLSPAEQQLALLRFNCAVNAAIRYELADALLAHRDKKETP